MASTGIPISMPPAAPMTVASPDFFCAGRWKHARIVAGVHVVFETILLALSASIGWWFGVIFPLFAVVGAGITAGAQCCRDNAGKCMANAHIVLVSLSFIGSAVSIGVLSVVVQACDILSSTESRYATESVCDYVKALLAFEVICLVLRISSIVFAARVTCCRPAEWNVQVAVAAPQQYQFHQPPVPVVMTTVPPPAQQQHAVNASKQ
jgi:hypothetical protein